MFIGCFGGRIEGVIEENARFFCVDALLIIGNGVARRL